MDIAPGKMQQQIRERLLTINRTIKGDSITAFQELIALGDVLDTLPAHVAEDINEGYRQFRSGKARPLRLFQ